MKIRKLIDLSIPINNNTPIYPGDPKPNIHSAASIEKDGYNVSHVIMGSHTGTHVDAPYHFNKDGLKMDELPLNLFLAEGVVIDVTGKDECEEITREDLLPYTEKLVAGRTVLFHTGWSKFAGDEKYYKHPYIGKDVIHFLLCRGIRVFLIDALNIDPPDGSSFEGHSLITGMNGVIGENYTNFDLIDFDNPFIITLPLYFRGLDGSPVRAVAVDFDSE